MDAETPEPTCDDQALALLRAAVAEDLDEAEREYSRSGNPVHVWRAIQATAFAQLPIPDWARPYLDTCAYSICALAEMPPAEIAPAVAKAMGFVAGGRTGRGSCFSEVRDTAWMRHARMAEGFIRSGDKPQWAFQRTADLYGVSPTTVRRAHERLLDSRKSGLSENTRKSRISENKSVSG